MRGASLARTRRSDTLIWVPGRRVAIAVIVNRPSSLVDDLLAYRWKGRPSLMDLARRSR
jgi:hypothetical protein